MSTVSTTSILGSDSISASRITINSNFLLLQNWINQYVDVFNIDSVNGILDLSSASTGRISAKTGLFDQIIVPVGGTAFAQINSNGSSQFVSVSSTSLNVSGLSTFNTLSATGPSTFSSSSTVNLNGTTNISGSFNILPGGHFVGQNTIYASGATAGTPFPSPSSGGGGRSSTSVAPYQITGTEDVIYAQCGPGWYMSVGTTGSSASALASGTRITIVNTSATGGFIATGLPNSGAYYTGFNTDTSYANYGSSITCAAGKPYQCAITLQWEPRIAQGTAIQEGSWIVLSSTHMTF